MKESKKRLLIVGGGKIGIDALEFARNNNYRSIIIDNNPECIIRSKVKNVYYKTDQQPISEFNSDDDMLIISQLSELLFLVQKIDFDYMIPAIPVHLIGMLSLEYLKLKGIKVSPSARLIREIKNRMEDHLVHLYDEKNGIIIASFMPKNNLCAPNCNEHLICPITKIEKSSPLYEVFKNVCVNHHSKILISEQLKPGLGGISGKAVKELLVFLDSVNNNILIGTACMCHGIINSFEID